MEPPSLSDASRRLTSGLAYFQRSQYAEALADFLWCFDRGGETDPSFEGARRSFVLYYIAALGRVYDPAHEALRERRAGLAGAVFTGVSTESQAADFAALNRSLGDVWLTVAAYNEVRGKPPTSVEVALLMEAVDQLVAARRYRDVVCGAANIPSLVRARLERTKNQLPVFSEPDVEAGLSTEVVSFLRRTTVEEACKYYEALLGEGCREDAAAVAEEVVAFDTSGPSFAALAAGAVRAGAVATAQALVRRGLAVLASDEAGRLEDLVRGLGLDE